MLRVCQLDVIFKYQLFSHELHLLCYAELINHLICNLFSVFCHKFSLMAFLQKYILKIKVIIENIIPFSPSQCSAPSFYIVNSGNFF